MKQKHLKADIHYSRLQSTPWSALQVVSASGVQERGEGWGGRREWENRREREALRASVRALACVEDPKSVLRTTSASFFRSENPQHYTCVHVCGCVCVDVSTRIHTHTHIIYAINRYGEHVATKRARNTETRGIQSGGAEEGPRCT